MARIDAATQVYTRLYGQMQSVNIVCEQICGQINMFFEQVENHLSAIEQATASMSNAATSLVNQEKSSGKTNQPNQNTESKPGKDQGWGEKIKGFGLKQMTLENAGKAFRASDQIAQTNTKLSTINDGRQTNEELNTMVYNSAQSTGSSYVDTAQMVTNIGANAGQSFGSTEEIVAFTELMQKNFLLAGTSASSTDAAVQQIIKGLDKGVISSNQLNTIMESAPNIVQSMADYMNVDIERIQEMATQGQLTADIMKNAMYMAADETNAKFSELPLTFGQIGATIQNAVMEIFQPVLMKINEIANSEGFQVFIQRLLAGLSMIAVLAMTVISIIGMIGSLIADNWGVIEPIIWGVVAAFLAHKVATTQAWLETLKDIAVGIVEAGIKIAQTAATVALTVAQKGLNAAIKANPLMWLVMLIGLVVMAIAAWIQSVGGLKVAWLIVVNVIMTYVTKMATHFLTMIINILNFWDKFKLGITVVKTGILNVLGDLKVKGLMIIENMVNGGIDLINSLISSIPEFLGFKIDTIEHVKFASKAAEENEAAKAKRNAEFMEEKNKYNTTVQQREQFLNQWNSKAERDQQEREAKIEEAKKEAAGKKKNKGFDVNSYLKEVDLGAGTGLDNSMLGTTGSYGNYPGFGNETLDSIGEDTAYISENTGKMSENMEASDQEFLRNVAERDAINKFTTAEVKLDFTANAQINSDMDIDGFVNQFTNVLQEQLLVTAEGVHA